MPAKSKKQQRLMAMVLKCKETGDCPSESIRKIAKGISKKDAKKFAKTKRSELPENLTFKDFLIIENKTEADAKE